METQDRDLEQGDKDMVRIRKGWNVGEKVRWRNFQIWPPKALT